MKKIILLSIITLFSSYSFSQNKNSYQVECVSVSNDGYVTIKIWNTKKGKCYSFKHARKDAIHAILYSGIPDNNGCTVQKPILANPEDQTNFQKIEKDFFSKKGTWANYTRASETETTLPASLGNKKWKVYQISVAKNLLRKYLEDQKIIKSLNSGF